MPLSFAPFGSYRFRLSATAMENQRIRRKDLRDPSFNGATPAPIIESQ